MAATGTATLNFGTASAQQAEASVNVIGQSGILSNSFVEAWVAIAATADHTVDEARIEALQVRAGNIVAGTGFTIYGEVLRGVAYGDFTINWVWA